MASSAVEFVFAEVESEAVRIAAEVLRQCFPVVNYAESPAWQPGVTDIWLVERVEECWPIKEQEVLVFSVGTIPTYLILGKAEELLKQFNLD